MMKQNKPTGGASRGDAHRPAELRPQRQSHPVSGQKAQQPAQARQKQEAEPKRARRVSTPYRAVRTSEANRHHDAVQSMPDENLKQQGKQGAPTQPSHPSPASEKARKHTLHPEEHSAASPAPASVASVQKDPIKAPTERKLSVVQWIRARWLMDEELPENDYYLRIAGRYRLVKYLVICLSLVLLFGMMGVYSEDITVENLRYLLRYLDSDGSGNAQNYATIEYDSSGDLHFLRYKEDLVVLRAGQTSIYGMDGRTILSVSNGFYSPILIGGEKYFLAYDPGQTSFSYTVYNAFSALHTQKLETPIYDAAISDEGMYAIVTEAIGYRGVVELYDRDFELTSKVYKDKSIWDIALSSSADRLLILTAFEENGEWNTEVHLLNPRSSETILQFTLHGLLAYACHFTSDGGFCLMTEQDMRFYRESDGEQNGKVADFDARVPIGWCFGDSYQAVTFNRTILGQDKIIRVCRDGEVVGDYELDGQITQTVFLDHTLYVLTETRVVCINCENGAQSDFAIESGCLSIQPIDSTHLLLSFRNRTYAIDPTAPQSAETQPASST